MSWSEEGLHRWLEARAGRAGDDAVFLARMRGRAVVCVDQVVVGVHVERGTPPARIGAKAAARPLSDLAASAATPRALFAAVAVPGDAGEAGVRALLAGIDRRGAELGAPLAGGDLTRTDGPLAVAVTAVGELPPGLRPPRRDRARAGHVLVATGAFGGSRLGRHLRIEPRVALGRRLAAAGAAALIDVSDGLARDVARLARAGGARAELDAIPVHRDAHRAARRDGRSPEWHALFDGEDHELVAALPPAAAARLLAAAPGDVALTRIGRLVRGSGLWIRGVRWDGRGGWVHGGGRASRAG
jgi:thiamine-monophosphate kinase